LRNSLSTRRAAHIHDINANDILGLGCKDNELALCRLSRPLTNKPKERKEHKTRPRVVAATVPSNRVRDIEVELLLRLGELVGLVLHHLKPTCAHPTHHVGLEPVGASEINARLCDASCVTTAPAHQQPPHLAHITMQGFDGCLQPCVSHQAGSVSHEQERG
jgi:hypothetical protein